MTASLRELSISAFVFILTVLLKCRELLKETLCLGVCIDSLKMQLKFLTLRKPAKFCFSCNAIMGKNDLSNFQALMFGFSAFRSCFNTYYLFFPIVFNPSHLQLKFHAFSLIHFWMLNGRLKNCDELMQVFGQLEPYAISCLQQSLAAGFEGSYTLFMNCSQMQKCCSAWRVGWGICF